MKPFATIEDMMTGLNAGQLNGPANSSATKREVKGPYRQTLARDFVAVITPLE